MYHVKYELFIVVYDLTLRVLPSPTFSQSLQNKILDKKRN